MTNRNGFLKDPRIRGKFNTFLKGAINRRPQPGQDAARVIQGRNAVAGRRTTPTLPTIGTGARYQQFIRNRSNEQGGLARPSAPTPVRFATPPQRRTF